MSREQIHGAIEAILFSYGKSVEVSRLAKALEITEDEVRDHILDMMLEYKKEARGIQIVRFEDRYQLCTKPELYPILKKTIDLSDQVELTGIQLEVLTIIAYKQPITKFAVDKIRGVDSTFVITRLIELGLIEEKGRETRRGSPILYGTTEDFLKRFGMSSLDDLPSIDLEARIDMEDEAEDEIKKMFKK